MSYMGIDPSTSSTGISIVDKDGQVVLKKKLVGKEGANDPAYMFHLGEELKKLVDEYGVTHMRCEDQFIGINKHTAIKTVRPTGVALYVAGSKELVFDLKYPSEWRKVFHKAFDQKVECTNPKKQDTYRVVKTMVDGITSYKKDNDITDSIGIAYSLYLENTEEGVTTDAVCD